MTKRDKLQLSWAKLFLESGGKGILHLCPRSGKIRTSINIFNLLRKGIKREPKILIAYPDKNIQSSWENDFLELNFKGNVEYITHISLAKVIGNTYDIIVIDEIHLLSENMKRNLNKIINSSSDTVKILGLSGTLSEKTELELKADCKLGIITNYTLDQAIDDKIISDYKIHVIKVDLDNSVIIDKKKMRTEKQKYNALSWIIEKKGPSLFLNLARMRLIHNSLSKTKKVKEILTKLKDKKVLVFCANNKTAKELGIKLHTSKFNSQEEFNKYIEDDTNINHYAVCKIGNTGVSFKNLQYILIGAFDSNSENLTQRICRSLILDEENKISNIYIVTSREKAELNWLSKSLEFFDKRKIKYYEQ